MLNKKVKEIEMNLRKTSEYEKKDKIDKNKDKVEVSVQDIIKNKSKYYGALVTNYTTNNRKYRIFYVDQANDFGDGENTVYLKADYCIQDETDIPVDQEISNTKYLRNHNSLWWEQRGDDRTNWNDNEKAVAWLCNPNNFTQYKDTTGDYKDKVNYVLGAPGVEMYVKSYNSVPHEIGNYMLEATTYIETNYPGYIYILNGDKSTISNNDLSMYYYTGYNTIDYSGKYHNMYSGSNCNMDGSSWWLASPSAGYSSNVCYVRSTAASLDGRGYGAKYGLALLVSLKSNVTLQVDTTK